jgi:hypothetical protein
VTSPAQPAVPPGLPVGLDVPRRWLVQEVWLVFALSLGTSGLRALLHLLDDLTSGTALRHQAAVLNGSQAPGRPWLDLALQLTSIAAGLVPVLLAAHLLTRSGESLRTLGLDAGQPRKDLVRGVLLAAVVGGTGLAFYLAAHASGANLVVVAEKPPGGRWRIPVLVLSAAQNAILERCWSPATCCTALRQLGWSDNRALLVSALLRGSYHLYQGFGGFAGNVAMGLVFGRLYQRWGG